MTLVRKPTNTAVDPLVRQFVTLADQLGYSLARIARITGMPTNVPYRWNSGARPTLYNFEAALNAIGYRLAIIPLNPPEKERNHDAKDEQ